MENSNPKTSQKSGPVIQRSVGEDPKKQVCSIIENETCIDSSDNRQEIISVDESKNSVRSITHPGPPCMKSTHTVSGGVSAGRGANSPISPRDPTHVSIKKGRPSIRNEAKPTSEHPSKLNPVPYSPNENMMVMLKKRLAQEPSARNPLTRSQRSLRHLQALEDNHKSIPIWSSYEQIVSTVLKEQVVLISGEPDSGKSSQVPIMIAENFELSKGQKMLFVAKNDIEAKNLAFRFAREMDLFVGTEVGYQVDFEARIDLDSAVKYTTYKYMLKVLATNHLLQLHNFVVLDEVHESNQYVDFVLGVLQYIVTIKPDFRVIMLSSQGNYKELQELYCNQIQQIKIPSRLHPVEIYHFPTELHKEELTKVAIQVLIQILLFEKDAGHILVYLPSEDEFLLAGQCYKLYSKCLDDQLPATEITFIHADHLIGESPMEVELAKKRGGLASSSSGGGQKKELRKIFITGSDVMPKHTLKIDPETAKPNLKDYLTISHVVDCGVTVLTNEFDIGLGHSRIKAWERVSFTVANKRALRCGHLPNAKCYRLYPESCLQKPQTLKLPQELKVPTSNSEVNEHGSTPRDYTKVALCAGFLQKAYHYAIRLADGLSYLPYQSSLQKLKDYKCFDADGNITMMGRIMLELPIDPALSMLFISGHSVLPDKAISLVALLSTWPTLSICQRDELRCEERVKLEVGFGVIPGLPVVREGSSCISKVLNLYEEFQATISRPRWKASSVKKWCEHNGINYRSFFTASKIKEELVSILSTASIEVSNSKSRMSPSTSSSDQSKLFLFYTSLSQVGQIAYALDEKTYLLSTGQVAIHRSRPFSNIPAGSYVFYHELLKLSPNEIELSLLTQFQPSDLAHPPAGTEFPEKLELLRQAALERFQKLKEVVSKHQTAK